MNTQLLKLVHTLVQQKAFGACLIMHDIHLASRYAEQVILLKSGKCFAIGDTKSILNAHNIESVFDVDAALVLHGHKAKKAPITKSHKVHATS